MTKAEAKIPSSTDETQQQKKKKAPANYYKAAMLHLSKKRQRSLTKLALFAGAKLQKLLVLFYCRRVADAVIDDPKAKTVLLKHVGKVCGAVVGVQAFTRAVNAIIE